MVGVDIMLILYPSLIDLLLVRNLGMDVDKSSLAVLALAAVFINLSILESDLIIA